jgi:hypothetical protein
MPSNRHAPLDHSRVLIKFLNFGEVDLSLQM